MTENNGWPGKPGVPLNPEVSGCHWVTHPADEQSDNGKMAVYWNGVGYWFLPGVAWKLEPVEMEKYKYHGPALTPAEVDARVSEAMKWRTAIYDALIEWHDPPRDDETPKAALRRLVHTEILAALDPAVSRPAADLVAKAKRDALKEAARTVNIVWLKFREKDEGSSDWIFKTYDDIPTGDDFEAAICALKGEGDD